MYWGLFALYNDLLSIDCPFIFCQRFPFDFFSSCDFSHCSSSSSSSFLVFRLNASRSWPSESSRAVYSAFELTSNLPILVHFDSVASSRFIGKLPQILSITLNHWHYAIVILLGSMGPSSDQLFLRQNLIIRWTLLTKELRNCYGYAASRYDEWVIIFPFNYCLKKKPNVRFVRNGCNYQAPYTKRLIN